MSDYLKLQLSGDGLVIYYFGHPLPANLILGENLRTGQKYSQEFPSATEANTAFLELPGLVHQYETVEELEVLLKFITTNYVLQTRSSVRGMIRGLRWQFGLASKEQQIWMRTWEQLEGKTR